MIERVGERLVVKAPLVIANAGSMLAAGGAALQAGEQVFDLSEVKTADSSALAVMFGWLRAAAAVRSTVKFAHLPDSVRSLADLYGVADLLPLA